MKKKLVALAAAAAFTVTSSVIAYAAFTCKVKTIDGGKVVMKCKRKNAKKLAVGQKVNVKKQIEGC